MFKKILFFVLIGGFLTLIGPDKPQAQTETESKALFYGGAKVLIGEPESGKGAFFAIGYVINDNLIFLGKYDATNNPEVSLDELKGSLILVSNPLIGNTGGIFFKGDVGGAYVQIEEKENDWKFALFTEFGIYFDLDWEKETRFWIGVGYHGINTIEPIYAVNVGISIIPKKWPW